MGSARGERGLELGDARLERDVLLLEGLHLFPLALPRDSRVLAVAFPADVLPRLLRGLALGRRRARAQRLRALGAVQRRRLRRVVVVGRDLGRASKATAAATASGGAGR